MSRKNRTAAPPFKRWRGLPDELTPELYHVSIYARALAIELFRAAPDDDTYTGKIATCGAWEPWLCRLLRVEGRQRSNVARHLRELNEAGVLLVGDGDVTICIGQPLAGARPDASHSHPTDIPLASHSTSTHSPLSSHLESTNCNHSEPLGEKRREEKRREEKRREEKRREESQTRAPESSARFEKPPVGEAPPNVPPSASAIPSWLAAWKVVERVTDKTGMLGHPGRHQEWLQQLAAAAEREVTCQTSPSFPEATERLVRAWMADPWVIKNDADIGNMGVWLRKRKPPTTKPIVPVRLRDRDLTDTELLAIDEFEEGELDVWQKQRRWELQARRDSADSRKLRAIVGGAS